MMGLDNGFYVKSNKRQITREMLPAGIQYPFDIDYDNVVEIVYWRKCWGLRGAVLDLSSVRSADDQNYKYTIDTPEGVMDLLKTVVHFMDPKVWEDEGDSIWEYDEYHHILEENVINFALIYTFMCENPDVYLEFYDSY